MSKEQYKVIPASEVQQRSKRKSPMHIILDSVEGDYWTMQQVADHIGVHIETIRRACRAKDDNGQPLVEAPSNAVRSGRVVIWLFTKDDVREIEDYFEERGFSITDRINLKKTLKDQIPA